MILTEKMSSYISTTFSFKGFLEEDVLLSSPAFFSIWDMSEERHTERFNEYINTGLSLTFFKIDQNAFEQFDISNAFL